MLELFYTIIFFFFSTIKSTILIKNIEYKMRQFKGLKGRYTFGNCQRPVFSLGVSHQNHKIKACENLGSIGHPSCEKMMKEKKTVVGRICVLSGKIKILVARSVIVLVRNYLFLKNYVTSKGIVSHNGLYYKQLSNARYQVRF